MRSYRHNSSGHLRQFAVAVTLLMMAVTTYAEEDPAASQAPAMNAIAIVVHKDLPVDDLSLDDLRSIFLADQQFWPDRTRITLLVRAAQSEERTLVLNRIYEMSEAQFRQYWIAKMFRAEVPRGPKIVLSAGMALDLVVAIPGSISFTRADTVTDDVKIVRVDGLQPGDPGYPLK
jgi:hypothetical protein